ncbi:HPr(Ser) kinase/phosphatase [Spiroplasma endosymbiont of Crioceris asparagi]|uniref:HPr(Ser) kinase/phosphatase n=1 Tax=Spiroplasma endosymbiont of Crioceris asparagi TaxID=3066286 RepID=UPI0030D4E56D
MNKLTIKKIVSEFKLDVLYGNEYLDNIVEIYGLNRPGLELAGFTAKGEKIHRLVLLATKEFKYLTTFTNAEKEKKYEDIFKMNLPAIIITNSFEDKTIFEVAKKYKTPILKSNKNSTTLTHDILGYLDDWFAPSIEVHGSLVNIFGTGVMLIGKSGIGKSELVLDLVKYNHLFVADDRVVVFKKMNKLYAKSHPILKNLIEVRGLGIIDVTQTFGHQIILDQTSLDLVIELEKFEQADTFERLGSDIKLTEYLETNIPYIKLPISSGRNVANIIETAVAKLKMSQLENYKPALEILQERIDKNES